MEPPKTQNCQGNPEEHKPSRRHHSPRPQAISQSLSHQDRVVLVPKPTDRPRDQKREPGSKPRHLWSLNLCQRRQGQKNGKRLSFQQEVLGNLGSCMESRTPPHTMHRWWLRDFSVRQDTIKVLEGNIGRTFSDINLTKVFSGQSPKATEIRAKIKRWDLIKLTSFCSAKKRRKKNQETAYRMGESSFK